MLSIYDPKYKSTIQNIFLEFTKLWGAARNSQNWILNTGLQLFLLAPP